MRVLGIVCSPRKGGNTDILVGKMADGAISKGAQVEKIYLGDLKIRECDGCHVCWQGKPCPKRDDMLDICSEIIENDAIVFGTPVYWYGPTALMKGFIDRFVYFNCPENRQKIKDLSAVLAVPFEEDNLETAGGVVEFFQKSLAYLEIKLLGQIIVPGVGEKGAILNKGQYLQQAYDLGRNLA